MLGKYENIAIKGIVSAVPEQIEENDAYVGLLGEKRVKKQTRMTGVKKRHIDKWEQMTSDLCITASKKLLEKLQWRPEEIKVLVFVTQSPSLEMPSSAFIVQKYLEIPDDCMAFDVNLGCSGFVSGVHIVSSLLQSYGVGGKGILLAGDIQRNIYKKKADCEDEYADQMLFGSAGTATAIEVVSEANSLWFDEKADGNRYEVISQRFNEGSVMDGEAVFQFAINDVTKYVVEFQEQISKYEKKGIDYYLFHQAQRFMLQNVAMICGIEDDKMLYSLEEYGNTSSASIPVTMCANRDVIKSRPKNCLMCCGFGIGLTCAMMQLTVSDDVVLEIVESDATYPY